MNREWTEEELEILRADRAAKVPVPVTAAKLNRPVPATYLRARKIGSLVQPHQSWDEAAVGRLHELVRTDPPLTDKSIAAELGRTVTQVRWKMQDLGLIGVRDRSKLAKITSAGAARPVRPRAPSPVSCKEPSLPCRTELPEKTVAASAQAIPNQPASTPMQADRLSVDHVVKQLEHELENQFKVWKAEAEAGAVRAAMAAIAEKMAIDQRLAGLRRRSAETEESQEKLRGRRSARREEARSPEATTAPGIAEQPRKPAPTANLSSVKAGKKRIVHAPVTTEAASAPACAPTSFKIVVLDQPAAPKVSEPDLEPVRTSGRGGWKAVRRNPSRLAAIAKGKATTRADAANLAEAAQAAIARFIAERGVTKAEPDTQQSLVTRLQARGYVVVRDGQGWLIDQRHHIANEQDLVAFASARGVTLGAAA